MPGTHENGQPSDEATLRIAASPERLYEIVTDIAHMGRLSPECTGGRWLGDVTGPAVGAKFKGTNKRGFARWSTTNEVEVASPGEEFTFKTLQSGYRWTYRFEPDGDATIVTERREPFRDRPLVAKLFTQVLLGGEDGHTDELRDGMLQTLGRLQAIAESP